MNQTPRQHPLHALLYVSTISPAAPLAVVGAIARHARKANALLDITGLLVFDGQRFAQHLEGSMNTVVLLFERILQDVRHINIQLLHQGPIPERKFRAFSMGFADVENADVLGDLENLSGHQAVAAFMEMSVHVDLSPVGGRAENT